MRLQDFEIYHARSTRINVHRVYMCHFTPWCQEVNTKLYAWYAKIVFRATISYSNQNHFYRASIEHYFINTTRVKCYFSPRLKIYACEKVVLYARSVKKNINSSIYNHSTTKILKNPNSKWAKFATEFLKKFKYLI